MDEPTIYGIAFAYIYFAGIWSGFIIGYIYSKAPRLIKEKKGHEHDQRTSRT